MRFLRSILLICFILLFVSYSLAQERKYPVFNKTGKLKDSIDFQEGIEKLFYSPELKGFLNEKVSDKIRKRARDEFYGDQVLNPFAHPNVVPPSGVEPGQEHFDFYGSGDADRNDTISWTDYNKIKSGTSNDRTDVNGDGETNSSDEELLYDYLTDREPYLPAHFKFNQDSTEKKNWFEKTAQIDTTDQIPPGPNWDCDEYSFQFANINESGTMTAKFGCSS